MCFGSFLFFLLWKLASDPLEKQKLFLAQNKHATAQRPSNWHGIHTPSLCAKRGELGSGKQPPFQRDSPMACLIYADFTPQGQ